MREVLKDMDISVTNLSWKYFYSKLLERPNYVLIALYYLSNSIPEIKGVFLRSLDLSVEEIYFALVEISLVILPQYIKACAVSELC